MTDHTLELCELLENYEMALLVDTLREGYEKGLHDKNIERIKTTLTRLRSKGPDGLRVVPMEPSEEMIDAARCVVLTDYSYASGTDMTRDDLPQVAHINELSAVDIYRAMLRAAGGERAD